MKPMLEISRDALFMREEAPAGCSLLTQSLETQEMLKNKSKLLDACSKSPGTLFLCEKSPCGMQRARHELVKLNSVKIQCQNNDL